MNQFETFVINYPFKQNSKKRNTLPKRISKTNPNKIE